MSQGDEDTEKSHEPTQKKLDDARAKGEIPKSADLTTASVYAGLTLAMLAAGTQSLQAIGAGMAGLLGRADEMADLWFSEGGTPMAGGLMAALVPPISVWFALPAIAAILAIIAQRAFTFAPEKLVPKLSRISLISNAKNKFGRSGLFEFAKSFVKLSLYSLVLGIFLVWRLPEIVTTAQLEPRTGLVVLAGLIVDFLSIVFVIAAGIGCIDLLWQHQEHLRKNRMSRKELVDETKQSEGDPHMKQQRRQRGYDIATNRMLADVPKADVIIVDPTHYAVALKWSRMPGAAPECVAKGVDEVAARIREAGAEAGVPTHRDPPTARALFATVEIGGEIRPEHYRAVAAAIRFAERMRGKARQAIR